MDQITNLTLTEVAAAIERGDLSPSEVARACLARVDALDGTLKAFVTVDQDDVLRQARARDEEQTTGGALGPLHGVPVGIKDLIDVAGLPTTASSRVLKENIASADAPVVTALKNAGAVVLGKTNTHEFALGVVSAPTRNPWDPECIPGGSSGGSAAAVAAGMCPVALGTDTAGSIRIPAALCGVTGLKPRPGIISLERVIPLAWSYDACGPIARSAADVALAWSTLTGSIPARAADPDRLTVATPENLGEVDLDPAVGTLISDAVATMTSAGARVVKADLPPFDHWDSPRGVPLLVEALAAHREQGWYPDHAGEYTADTLNDLRLAENMSAEKLLNAYRRLEPLKGAMLGVFDGVDVLALPTTPIAAPTVDAAVDRDDQPRPPITRALTRICGPVNVCGLAAISVPCGFDERGMPAGIQFVGVDEATVLAAALLYQRLTDFHTRRPPNLVISECGDHSGQ